MKKKNCELENEFNEWKDKEDQQLRKLNYPEDKIATLRKYDHDLFVNKARRQQRKEQITAEAFFVPFLHTIRKRLIHLWTYWILLKVKRCSQC